MIWETVTYESWKFFERDQAVSYLLRVFIDFFLNGIAILILDWIILVI